MTKPYPELIHATRVASLHCHPAQPCALACAIEVEIAADDTSLDLTYRLHANLAQLLLPALGPVRRGERLWEHSCFEVFVKSATDASYIEFNLAPSGEWAAYPFRDYRLPDDALTQSPLSRLETSCTQRELELRARVDWQHPQSLANLWLGLSAVIETSDGQKSWWALQHAQEKPDFHDPRCFTRLTALPFKSSG